VPIIGACGVLIGALVAGMFATISAVVTARLNAKERAEDRNAEATRLRVEVEQSIHRTNHASIVEAYRALFGIVLAMQELLYEGFRENGNVLDSESCAKFWEVNGMALVNGVNETKAWMLHANVGLRALLVEYFEYIDTLRQLCAEGPVKESEFMAELNVKAVAIQDAMRIALGLDEDSSQE